MTGKIKKLFRDKGFGFIKTSSGADFFFHQSAVKNTDFLSLEEGLDVEFEPSESEKGPRAVDIYV